MSQRLPYLRISENGRYLVQENGKPFFWLGDTAWELFHKLSKEEAETYLRNRAELGFNVVQAVALAELEGLTKPNFYGRLPLKKGADGGYDPALPDTDGEYSYWDHVDYIVDLAGALGIYVAFLPTWGDKYHLAWGKGPVVFDGDNAKVFGEWLGVRYRHRSQLVWVLGGDRALDTRLHFEVNQGLAQGLRQGDDGKHLITLHPRGDFSSSINVHDEEWLDFNMIQSGHGEVIRNNYTHVARDYERAPVKPTIDAEPCYEDHPISFKPEKGYFDEVDVRIGAYYGVFSGGFGHTYGHHSIWSMTKELGEYWPADYVVMRWDEGLHRPGAAQMQHVRRLLESRPFLERVPDQSLIAEQLTGVNYTVATRGEAYAFVYSPNGIPFKLVMGKISGSRVKVSWYDPRNGSFLEADVVDNSGEAVFQPPSSGRGNDWVLVLDGVE